VYRALNLNTGQMVAVKRIGLEGLKEEEIAQLMHEVDLVKMLSHPSIVKYEGMARDENTLSIVLECVFSPPLLLYRAVASPFGSCAPCYT
jgi:serine/threonine protein kinase